MLSTQARSAFVSIDEGSADSRETFRKISTFPLHASKETVKIHDICSQIGKQLQKIYSAASAEASSPDSPDSPLNLAKQASLSETIALKRP